ncbi:MAG: XRE family transcriptional regulator [Candidatus Omnitrophota bacterium]|jgi:ribosome-binding protein aMBF1 (putative translation factor)|nr:MAG: XRE family transcriptional regulator [Candidatus Omnitrophota bacterium]
MKEVKGTDALEALGNRYGIEPDDEDVLDAYEQMMIAQVIYDARTEAGLTQQKLAELIETKQSVISRLENADYEGNSLSLLRKIAHALNKRIRIELAPLTRHDPAYDLPPTYAKHG